MRILVVDDDDAIAFTSVALLAGHGFDAVGLTDPTAVLATVSAFAPDCVLLDLGMPARDGADVARDLVALPLRPRVVVVSGSPERADELAAIGVDEFVVKPADPARLAATLRRLG